MKNNSHNHDRNGHHNHHQMMINDFRKRFFVSIVFTLPVLILSPMIAGFLGISETVLFSGSNYVLFAVSTFIFIYGGYPFLKGLYKELRSKQPGMMTLIALAIIIAYGYSSGVVLGLKGRLFYWELATLIDIMLLGHWIEMKSVMSASNAMEKLAELMPSEAHKISVDGNTEDIPVEKLSSGDKVLVKPGEKFPADGVVYDGDSSVNESMVTGESKPVSKKKGDEVIGGSVNGEGALKVEIQKTGDDTFLSKVIVMVREAQESKSRTQTFADRAAFWLTIVAILSGAITMFAWLVIMNSSFNYALSRTVTVMVITCPHALGLAIPLVIAVSTALSAQKGLLIRNRTAFEKARNIQAVIFDKTGTLTEGEFGVSDTISFNSNMDTDEMISFAASVETNSEHPIAQGIVNSAKEKFKVDKFNSIPGKGAEGIVKGKKVKVVSPGYLREKDIKIDKEGDIEKLTAQGKTVVFLLIEDQPACAIALADKIRRESKKAVEALKGMGIRSIMLTGDNKNTAKWVAGEIGIEEYYAEVLPEDKNKKVKEIQKRGLVVAMTGDGVNDAPALASADIGIAIGTGTDVAVESADIILVKSNPLDIVSTIKLGKATYSKMIQNLIWATGYNAVAIPLAAGVLFSWGIILSPAVGALLMSLSTVIVAINARLLKKA